MRSDLAKMSDTYGITLELTGRPKGEIRDDSCVCIKKSITLFRIRIAAGICLNGRPKVPILLAKNIGFGRLATGFAQVAVRK